MKMKILLFNQSHLIFFFILFNSRNPLLFIILLFENHNLQSFLFLFLLLLQTPQSLPLSLGLFIDNYCIHLFCIVFATSFPFLLFSYTHFISFHFHFISILVFVNSPRISYHFITTPSQRRRHNYNSIFISSSVRFTSNNTLSSPFSLFFSFFSFLFFSFFLSSSFFPSFCFCSFFCLLLLI